MIAVAILILKRSEDPNGLHLQHYSPYAIDFSWPSRQSHISFTNSDQLYERCCVQASSLTVGDGAWSDPVRGLAHFLEHSLFLGTEEYPVENQ